MLQQRHPLVADQTIDALARGRLESQWQEAVTCRERLLDVGFKPIGGTLPAVADRVTML